MIAVEIEKELKGENRVIGKFTLRQVVCMILIVFIPMGLYYLIVRPDSASSIVPPAMICGTIAYFFGFHKKNGMTMEYFAFKKLKEYMLLNNNRRYRTKNKYLTMMNKSYADDRNKDLADKRAKKTIKKKEKAAAKKRKSSKMKPYR